jgi:hypothetical protein
MEFESKAGKIFSYQNTSRTPLGPTQPPIQWVPGFFPGSKAAGSWRSLKRRRWNWVEFRLHFPSLFSWSVENNFTFAISALQMRACPPLSGIPEANNLVPSGGGGWGGEIFCGRKFHDLIQLLQIYRYLETRIGIKGLIACKWVRPLKLVIRVLVTKKSPTFRYKKFHYYFQKNLPYY